MAEWPPTGGVGVETDPIYAAQGATDVELSAAVATITTSLAAKQDAGTAATDAELAAAVAVVNAAIALKQDASLAATDAELAAAVAAINSALAAKQDSSSAATDAELAAAVATLNTALSAKQDASLAATDIEIERRAIDLYARGCRTTNTAAQNLAIAQAAMDELTALPGGGTLLATQMFPMDNLVLKRKVKVEGVGWGSGFKAPASQAVGSAVIRASEDAADGTALDNYPFHASIENLRVDGNARGGALGDGIRLQLSTEDVQYVAGRPDWLNVEDFNDPWVHVNHVFVLDAANNGFHFGRVNRDLRVTNCFAYECRRYGFVVTATDYHLDHCDAGACADGFFLAAEDARVVACKAWYCLGNTQPGASFWSDAGRDFAGNGSGFLIYGLSGAVPLLSGLQMEGCMAQDNYGWGFVLQDARSNVLRGCKAAGNVAGGVFLLAAGVAETEDNVVDVDLAWGDRPADSPPGSAAQQLVGIRIDGAGVKNNHVELHEDDENARAAGYALVQEANSGKANLNWLGGNAFEKWTAATLNSTWAAFDAAYDAPGYRKEGNSVVLRGALKGAALLTLAFTLPAHLRPAKKKLISCVAFDASAFTFFPAILFVEEDGKVTPLAAQLRNAAGDLQAWVNADDGFFFDGVVIPL